MFGVKIQSLQEECKLKNSMSHSMKGVQDTQMSSQPNLNQRQKKRDDATQDGKVLDKFITQRRPRQNKTLNGS